ncbi:MAG: hypothetical protein IPG09_15910 [Ignavibacteria bacterium]|nr:hypothetical protein [Ignavibacteria bacterium]
MFLKYNIRSANFTVFFLRISNNFSSMFPFTGMEKLIVVDGLNGFG